MANNTKKSKPAAHGLFYMENAGGYHAKPAPEAAPGSTDEQHQPSCFALEEEKGEGWKGAGSSRPAIRNKRPSL